MRGLAPLLLVAAISCAAEASPRAVGGLTARLRVEKPAYVLGEQISFDLEIRNEGAEPVSFVPVHWWDRAYAWHRSSFPESEASLVVDARIAGVSKEPTSAGG